MELRRLYDHVGADTDPAIPGRCSRRRTRQLAVLLRPERDRRMDAPVLRRFRLRRSRRVRQKLTHQLRETSEDARPDPGRRQQKRETTPTDKQELARLEDIQRQNPTRD